MVSISQIKTLRKRLLASKIENINKKNKTYKTLSSILVSANTIVIIGSTKTSATLSVSGVALNVVPTSAWIACALSLGKKALNKLILNNYTRYKKHYEEHQQTVKSPDKLDRKSLQNSLVDKSDYESLCNSFNKYVIETKMNVFS